MILRKLIKKMFTSRTSRNARNLVRIFWCASMFGIPMRFVIIDILICFAAFGTFSQVDKWPVEVHVPTQISQFVALQLQMAQTTLQNSLFPWHCVSEICTNSNEFQYIIDLHRHRTVFEPPETTDKLLWNGVGVFLAGELPVLPSKLTDLFFCNVLYDGCCRCTQNGITCLF